MTNYNFAFYNYVREIEYLYNVLANNAVTHNKIIVVY